MTDSGAEANTLIALSMMGCKAAFITRLPENEIAKCAEAMLHQYGVSMEHTVRGGHRISVLYLKMGASQRPSKVIYDRAGSSFAESELDHYAREDILDGADWLHFTGIAAALSKCMPQILEEALTTAKSKHVTVSCDRNYRGKLWSSEQAKRVMSKLVPMVDVIMENEEDAEIMLGIQAGHSKVESGELDFSGYERAARGIYDKYGVRQVAYSLRESISASENGMSGMFFYGNKAYFSHQYRYIS